MSSGMLFYFFYILPISIVEKRSQAPGRPLLFYGNSDDHLFLA